MKKKLYTLPTLLVVGRFVLTACAGTATSISTDTPASTNDSLGGSISVSGASALYPMMTVCDSK